MRRPDLAHFPATANWLDSAGVVVTNSLSAPPPPENKGITFGTRIAFVVAKV
jgi:hypothetical protein